MKNELALLPARNKWSLLQKSVGETDGKYPHFLSLCTNFLIFTPLLFQTSLWWSAGHFIPRRFQNRSKNPHAFLQGSAYHCVQMLLTSPYVLSMDQISKKTPNPKCRHFLKIGK